ncbi:Cutinase transcription factor 1 alpha [Fusarium acutatum]|uniref:Cutinase transcription factor 1 alpha n=1 Tax=Fusarium acutatum TaxID=78861 RepID=A0A8H4JXB5_9HYPO|nr:Cutinase transcription factor 1 alpha [Fusarium acutatum]
MNPTRRSRARQACRACNARRVKCNVVESWPCFNCKDHQVTCELRESRRGRHRRPTLSQAPKSPVRAYHDDASVTRHEKDEVRAFVPPLESGLSSPPGLTVQAQDSQSVNQIINPSNDTIQVQESQDACDIEWEPSLPLHQHERTQTQTHNEVQDNHNSEDRPEEDETVFLGESTSITYLHGTQTSPESQSTTDQGFVYRLPEGLSAKAVTSQWELERKQARIRLLQLEGAFSFPSKPTVENILMAYFKWFHTCFAIVDEPDIWDQHRRGIIQPLLLQAMLFIGVMHCSEQDLEQVGLGSRQRAKYILYNRAKGLFDAEAEPKSLVVIQALFLMSFYRAGPLLQKDTRHWLAVAVSQAQARGLHRASREEKDKTQQLRKRVWWSIYIRERQCAAALGLPNRVRDEDCDVEALDENDFQYAFDLSLSSSRAADSIAYMIGMVELSRVLGRIMHRDFLPSMHLSSAEREEIRAALALWIASLPASMHLSPSETSNGLSFLASMLHLAYNNLHILLYRSGCGNLGDSGSDTDGKVAIQAAARNSTIIEHMLIEDFMCHGQIHVITNIFNTLCIHTLQLKELQGGRRFVAEHRAKLCLVGLRELQKTWEYKNWILQLFFQYLDHTTALRLQVEGESGDSTNPPQQPGQQRKQQGDTPVSSVTGNHFQMTQGHDETTSHLHIDQAKVHDASWPIEIENVGQFLHTQIEDRFINGDGGAMDWYMADLFTNALPP